MQYVTQGHPSKKINNLYTNGSQACLLNKLTAVSDIQIRNCVTPAKFLPHIVNTKHCVTSVALVKRENVQSNEAFMVTFHLWKTGVSTSVSLLIN